MLLNDIAKELGAELVEHEYWHTLHHPDYQLTLKGVEKYGNGKFKPEEHQRIHVSVSSRTTPLQNTRHSNDSITVSAKRSADAIAKDIERRIVADAKAFEIQFAEVLEKETRTKDEWEQLCDYIKANDPADYVGVGTSRVRLSFRNQDRSYRHFNVDFDRIYRKYTVSVDTPVLTPFAQLADEGDEHYRIIQLRGYACYSIEYRSMPNTHYVYRLFDMFLDVHGFKHKQAA